MIHMLFPQLGQCRLSGHHRGFNLAFFVVMAVALIGFMGIAIYVGAQAYLQGELQKAASTAVLAGAASYYEGKPLAAQSGTAISTATQTFNTIVNNSGALRGFNARIVNTRDTGSNDAVSMTVTGTMPTPFMALIGVNEVTVNAEATGRALMYVPTASEYGGSPVVMFPPDVASYDLQLDFPVVDMPNSDEILIMQVEKRGYTVEACSGNTCYDLVPGARPFASGEIKNRNGRNFIYGSASIDIGAAGIGKAEKLRFKDDMIFNKLNPDGSISIDWVPMPTIINSVELYGYSSACVSGNMCSVPFGFRPMP